MGCCGRPNNRAGKGAKTYHERYAYLTAHQRAKQLEMSGSKCVECDAITMSDTEGKCVVCGSSKTQKQEKMETG